jgi:hypothetical protein
MSDRVIVLAGATFFAAELCADTAIGAALTSAARIPNSFVIRIVNLRASEE